MNVVLEKVVPAADESFTTVDKAAPAFAGRYHFHPEVEITLIERGFGRRVVGDSIEPFAADDLVLLGENLPHQYLSKSVATYGSGAVAKVIKFRSDFIGDAWLRLPEFKAIAALLKRSGRGLRFGSDTTAKARPLIRQTFGAAGPKRILHLMELLETLSQDRHAIPIASAGYVSRITRREGDTIHEALQYLNRCLAEPVPLAKLCRYLHVSPATCNRLFQKSIGRSFKPVLIEMRISHACRLLLETDRPIVDVAYSSGFNNLSNFNRQFKRMKGQAPCSYRNSYHCIASSGRTGG